MKILMLILFLCLSFTALAHPPGDRPDRGERDGQYDDPGSRGRHFSRPGPNSLGGRGPWHRPPPNPLVEALDTDGDHVISPSELENATAALTKLDQDGDGQLTHEEMRPPLGPHGGPEGDRHRGPREGPGNRGSGKHGSPHRYGGGPESHQCPPPFANAKKTSPEQMMLHAMKFDEDGDEKLTQEELRNFIDDFTRLER